MKSQRKISLEYIKEFPVVTSLSFFKASLVLNNVGQGLAWIFSDDSRTKAAPLSDGARFKCALIDSKIASACK